MNIRSSLTTWRTLTRAALGTAILALLWPVSASAQEISEQEAYEIAKEAYVYAFPFMLQYTTQMQLTNVAEPTGRLGQAPFNQFSHASAFAPADFKVVVRPNVDTLYSMANLDLEAQPLVLTVPATDRYFMLTLQSLWTDVFAVPGTRTTGANTQREFLLVGPRWQGQAPEGLEIIRSPTRIAVVGGRTQTNGVADFENVHKIQQGYKVVPLSAWGKGDYVAPKHRVDPAIDMTTRPRVQIENMPPEVFFARFADLLKDNPPGSLDYPMLHRLERVGLQAGKAFDLNAAAPAIQQAFSRATADGKLLVQTLGHKAAGAGGQGWTYTLSGGAYGANYRERAAVAYYALGLNLPQDAVYPSLTVDSDGRPLDGSQRYVLHLSKAQLPPVHAFWSLTAYDAEGYFMPNALKRQALGDRDKLVMNADGSLDLYIQADSPGAGKEANWLPVSGAAFTLMLRLYWPRSEVLAGTWAPPAVQRLN
ncbi:DUF1254 domain-containing protein [Pseudomonas putida]|uniref:DUF1254 domain-containing protein n=1 Tax=Pseudomonas putida TaxID=303 RepID=UPI0023653F60|nr:DUF1254 domain-containing protein [Pseudomonas putida]MDD2050596.1 DUF1254 domain-containing protein [Pseudomonas putida]